MYSIIDIEDVISNIEYEFKVWKDVSCASHSHHILEAVIVFSGTFKIEKEQTEYILTQNQMMFIMPFEIHKFETIGESKILVIQISPHIISDFNKHLKDKKPKNPVCNITDKEIDFIQQHIKNIDSNKSIELNCIFFTLLSIISRGNEFTNFSPVNDIFRKTLIYISSHYEENISLKDIAKQLGVSYVYLSRIFSQNANVRFNDFINNFRISKSAFMLTNTSFSISEISYMCGFGSIRNFNRVFSSELNCTPKEFRKAKKSVREIIGTEL